jgi:maltose O-acetyltransferase
MYKFFRFLYIKRLIKHGLNVGHNLQIEKGANIDSVFPELITIGNNVTLAKDSYILSHDGSTKKIIGYTKVAKTIIGNNVFIGTKAVILPGIIIGNGSIVGACSIVTKDIPENEVWAGNPAHYLCTIDSFKTKREIEFLSFGKPLLLGKKRVYHLSKKLRKAFLKRMSNNFGFIE